MLKIKSNMNKIVILAIILILIYFAYFYYRLQVPYTITKQNVSSIYLTYTDNNGTHKINVNDSDKNIIISEVSKMKQSSIEGSTEIIKFKFTIELVNGNKFTFYQTSFQTVALESDKDKFFRNINAPKTAKFIERFIKENNLHV